MPRPWDARLRQLARRSVLSGALAATGRWLIPGAPLAIGFYALTRWSPWARFFAPYVGAGAIAVLLGVVIIGALRARRSDVYYAKWIDMESGLEDRLASAVDWDQLPARDPFQEQCVSQLALEVAAHRWELKLPRTRPRQLPLITFAALVLAATAVAQVRQRPPSFENDARAKLTLGERSAKAADRELSQARSPQLADPELEQMANDVSSLIQAMGSGKLDRETTLAEMEQLRQRASERSRRLGWKNDLSALGEGGSIGSLARALSSGDPGKGHDALEEVRAQLQLGALTDEEAGRLKPLLEAFAQLSHEPLASRFSRAANLLDSGNQPAAASQLAQALSEFSQLDKQLAGVAALDRVEKALALLEQSVASSTAEAGLQAGTPADPNVPGLTDRAASKSHLTHPTSGGAGANSVAEHGAPEAVPGETGPSAQLAGVWNGRVLRQLFDTSSSDGQSEEAKRLLIDHQRVVEDRFLHDDVPLEYQEAVRAYFASLHRK